jgi:diketogulonate reductase-like aldo/keto reductase
MSRLWWLVAIAYVMQKTPFVFPIVGGRKVEQLHGNIEALDISLTPQQIKEIEDTLPFDHGFPYNIVVRATIVVPTLISPAIAGRWNFV